jgi:hypothetical protein
MSTKTFQQELDELPLTEDIRVKALEVYARVAPDTGTRRCNVRRKLIFFTVYCGNLEAGKIVAPAEVAHMVGINPSEAAQALKQFSAPRTSYVIPTVHTRPVDLIAQYARTLRIREDLLPEIEAMCQRLTDAPEFHKMHPQPVAAAVLRYYMELNGLSTDVPAFLVQFDTTRLALDKAYERVVMRDNQE